MNRTVKDARIAEIKSKFDKAISVALVDFKGLSVASIGKLRREFKKAKVEYRVVKNTVIRHAIKDSAYGSLVGDLSPDRKNSTRAHVSLRGMTGVAWSYEDPGAAAKIIETFKKEGGEKVKSLKIKTGLLSGELIEGAALAKVPGLKETQALIAGLLQAPSAEIYTSLLAPGLMIVALLEAHVKKLEEAGQAA
ncbi:MAG: 50S ribosomal protein L10 [Deltaproteobacteria bacterium]|nr:50S ribosomal protein L10 [Deltaproteobacteria bacterium]